MVRDCSGFTGRRYAYPVFSNEAGEILDFYYDPCRQCWNMRHQVRSRTILVRMFGRGHSFDADFSAARLRVAREAKRRGMTMKRSEMRT